MDLIDYKIRIYKAKIRYNEYSNQKTHLFRAKKLHRPNLAKFKT